MKNRICIVFLLFFIPSFGQNPTYTLENKQLKSFTKDVVNNYDLKHHRCNWNIDPAVNYIEGNITSCFLATALTDSIAFNLSYSFTVDSVIYHEQKISFYQSAEDILHLLFPDTLSTQNLDSVQVFYQGITPGGNEKAFFTDLHNNTPIAWTLSEPFGSRNWWPCKQSLHDKVDSIDIIVTTPKPYKVASNGILLSTTDNDSTNTFHWKSTYPIAAYLIGISITDYLVYSDYVPLKNGDTLEVLNYVYPESENDAKSATPEIIKIIQLFDSLSIPYPFSAEKYGHAQFNWGGGMEHQTMSFVKDFNFALLAHECAHQWFGNHITCGSWEDIWLNESFATYFEGLATEHYFPDQWRTWKEQKLESIISEPDGSVLCDDTTSASRILDGRLSYNKGAYLLHMLRWKLDDSLFFQSIKNYLNDSSLANGFAKTPQLIAHFESTAETDLSGFFSQWYYGQGFPSYNLTWSQKLDKVTLNVEQTNSHNSVSFFKMPIQVQFIGAHIDTLIRIDHTYSGQEFTFTIPFPLVQVRFDPNLHLLSGNNTVVERLILENESEQVMVFPNPVKNELNILLLNNSNPITQFEIIDSNGKVVYESEALQGFNKLIQVDVSNLIDGVYHTKIQLQNGVNNRSFVKAPRK